VAKPRTVRAISHENVPTRTPRGPVGTTGDSLLKNSWNRIIYACWAPFYDRLIGIRPFVGARRNAIELLNLRADDRVLIVGVGTGADLPLLPDDAEVVGVDLSRAMLRRAAEKREQAPPHTQLIAADAMSLPFRNRSFDAVILNLIVSVVPDAPTCLREVSRVSRPEAHIVVFDKFLNTQTPPLWRRAANLLMRFFGTDINRRIDALLPGTGLQIVSQRPGAFGGAYVLVELRHESC